MAILAANDFKQIVLVVEMQGRDSSSHDFVVLVFQGLAMSLITSILYPVDFSPSSVAMAAYVKRAAALLGARASLLHVVDPTGYNALQLYVRPISEVSEEYLGIGRERLNSFLTAEFPRGAVPKNPDFGGRRDRDRSSCERGKIRSHHHAHTLGHFPADATRKHRRCLVLIRRLGFLTLRWWTSFTSATPKITAKNYYPTDLAVPNDVWIPLARCRRRAS
jgi:hypothetical protein